MKCYKRVIGIDREVEYSVEAIQSKITKRIKEPAEILVVCEATGGLEWGWVD